VAMVWDDFFREFYGQYFRQGHFVGDFVSIFWGAILLVMLCGDVLGMIL